MEATARYSKIDGLRAYASIGIVLMHVLANGAYELDGFLFGKLIPSFSDLVFLFMVISAFSMCCGYYDKISNGEIAPKAFYSRRFKRIWPYFALLCLLDLALSPSLNSLYEVIANLTLCFGLLPNADISVIGVGWFLGLIFVFYMLFPFFCSLLSSKRTAWVSFVIALIMNYLCSVRFQAGRTNIVFYAVFFLAGGLIYLYRDVLGKIAGKYGLLLLLAAAAVTAAVLMAGATVPAILVWCALVLIYALGDSGKQGSLLSNPLTKFLSGISMEVYLSHMVIFRLMEKLDLLHLFSSPALSYCVAAVGTVIGTVAFALALRWLLERIQGGFQKIAGERRHD